MAEGPPSPPGIWGAPSPSALAVCKGHIDHNPPSIAFVHTGYTGLVGLVVCQGQIGPEKPLPLWWSLSRQSHCNHVGLLHISLGAFRLFGHIPITENLISQLEQIIH